jgi:hypothetical protein
MERPRISIMVYWPKEDGQHHGLFTLTKVTLNLTMMLTYFTTQPSIQNGICISPMG